MNLGEPRCISVDDVVYDLIWKPIDCPVSDSVKKVFWVSVSTPIVNSIYRTNSQISNRTKL